jgi:hypothetical protein
VGEFLMVSSNRSMSFYVRRRWTRAADSGALLPRYPDDFRICEKSYYDLHHFVTSARLRRKRPLRNPSSAVSILAKSRVSGRAPRLAVVG